MCGSFPWDICIIFTGISLFTSSHPVHHLYMFAIHQLWFPKFLPPPISSHLHPTNPKRNRLYGEEEHFLKCLIILHVRWIWEMVWLLDQMTQCNYATVSMKEKERENERNCWFFFLPLLLFSAVSRLYFRLAIQKWGCTVPTHPLNQNKPMEDSA